MTNTEGARVPRLLLLGGGGDGGHGCHQTLVETGYFLVDEDVAKQLKSGEWGKQTTRVYPYSDRNRLRRPEVTP